MGFFEDTRSLTQGEKDLAKTVFKNKVSFDNVYIGNRTGIGNAPWTEYEYIDEIVGDRFILHMGPTGYTNAASDALIGKKKARNVFIHELVHVWQGQHSLLSGSYQLSSAMSQLWAIITTGGRQEAYKYKPGQDWDSYNVEQQAKIVEDWFAKGASESESDDLFRYIRDNIRK